VRALCDSIPVGDVVLTVEAESPARRLYSRLGFRDLARTRPEVWPTAWVTVMGTTLPLLPGAG